MRNVDQKHLDKLGRTIEERIDAQWDAVVIKFSFGQKSDPNRRSWSQIRSDLDRLYETVLLKCAPELLLKEASWNRPVWVCHFETRVFEPIGGSLDLIVIALVLLHPDTQLSVTKASLGLFKTPREGMGGSLEILGLKPETVLSFFAGAFAGKELHIMPSILPCITTSRR